jgi:hypothetical protein
MEQGRWLEMTDEKGQAILKAFGEVHVSGRWMFEGIDKMG